jgi:hypothetical protein
MTNDVDDPKAYRRRVAEALMRTIFDQSLIDIDGKKTAYVMTADVCEALIDVMAALLEDAPICRTPQEMRKTAEAVGKKLHTRMKAVRDIHTERGERIFDSELTVNLH